MEASPTRRYVAYPTSSSLITLIGIGILTLALQLESLSPSWHTTLSLARIMLPYLIFICLAALSMGLLNAGGHFTSLPLHPPY